MSFDLVISTNILSLKVKGVMLRHNLWTLNEFDYQLKVDNLEFLWLFVLKTDNIL